MNPEELLNALRELEIRLRSDPVQDFFKEQPEATRERFVSRRQEVSALVGTLTNAQLDRLADRLEGLSPALQAGLQALEGKMAGLKNAVEVLEVLDMVIRLASRMASRAV